MSRENPLWGAPRIHGELVKLGIEVGETSEAEIARRLRVGRTSVHRILSDSSQK